jgi:hypothetical protein
MGQRDWTFSAAHPRSDDVADEDHRSGCGFFFLATGKGAGRHIVLHDLDAVFVLKVDTGNLVKRYAVPQANQAHGFSAHVVKQVRDGGLTAETRMLFGEISL